MPGWFWMQPALPQGQGSAPEPSHPELTQILKCLRQTVPPSTRGTEVPKLQGHPMLTFRHPSFPLAGSGAGPWPPSLGEGSPSPREGARLSDARIGAAPQLGSPPPLQPPASCSPRRGI